MAAFGLMHRTKLHVEARSVLLRLAMDAKKLFATVGFTSVCVQFSKPSSSAARAVRRRYTSIH